MSVQLVTRIPDSVASAVDDLVRDGHFGSRSDVVRAGLETIIEARRREAIGQAIVEGYKRVPQDHDDLHWPDAAAAAMIAEDPGDTSPGRGLVGTR